MSKACQHCGALLPEDASFCPHCAQSQITRTEKKLPRPWRRKALYALLGVLVLAAAALVVFLVNRPRTFEGDAAVTYTDSDGTYELLVSFYPGDILNKRPIANKTVQLSPDERSIDTPMLGVFQNGELADVDAFFEKVESCTLEAFPNENGALELGQPLYTPDYAPAARECNITYTGDSGTNRLVWTLRMKNGDVIRLKQTYEVIPLVHQTYTPEDTPLNTLAELNALLARIDEEVPADVIVDITLPPVTYDGGLTIRSRAVNLYGCADGSGRTVFTGSVSVQSDYPANVMLFDLDFIGNGGIGLSATASVYMGGCTFTGWDIGAIALDGGMIGVENCTFRGNGIGFKYYSAAFHSFNNVFPGCLIADNDIGVQFATLGGSVSIDFAGSTFSGNRVDIDNPISYPINTEGALFE